MQTQPKFFFYIFYSARNVRNQRIGSEEILNWSRKKSKFQDFQFISNFVSFFLLLSLGCFSTTLSNQKISVLAKCVYQADACVCGRFAFTHIILLPLPKKMWYIFCVMVMTKIREPKTNKIIYCHSICDFFRLQFRTFQFVFFSSSSY